MLFNNYYNLFLFDENIWKKFMVIIIILIATIDIAMFYLLSKTAKIFNLIELISRRYVRKFYFYNNSILWNNIFL